MRVSSTKRIEREETQAVSVGISLKGWVGVSRALAAQAAISTLMTAAFWLLLSSLLAPWELGIAWRRIETGSRGVRE